MGRKNSAANADAKREPLSRKERRQLKEQAKREELVQDLLPLQRGLESESEEDILGALRTLGAALADGGDACAGVLAQGGLVEALFSACGRADQPCIQFEALQAVSRLAEADADALTERGAVAALLPRLGEAPRPTEQALGAFARLAAASLTARDAVVAGGAARAALERVSVQDACQPSPGTQKMAAFLRAVCDWEVPPDLGDTGAKLVNALAVLSTSNEHTVLLDALTALARLDFRDEERLLPVLKHGLFERLLFLLEQPSAEVCVAAARAARKAAFDSVFGMQAFLLQEPALALRELLGREEPEAQREACALLADVLAAGGPHLKEVADAGCLPRLATLLREGPEEVKQVAARGFASLSASCPPQRLQALVEEDAVAAAVALLEPEVPPQTVRPVLRFLEGVVIAGLYLQEQSGLHSNRFAETIRNCGGIEKCKVLGEMYGDRTVSARTAAIIEALNG